MNTVNNNGAGVTVIVPTYNRAEFLGGSLEGILAQTCPPVKVVVVDDGSSDDTRNIVESFGDRVCYVYKENGGKPSAINVGLGHVESEYVLVFDDDDLLLPDALENLLAPLKNRPDLGFSQGRMIYFRGDPFDESSIVLRANYRPIEPGEHFPTLLMGGAMCFNATLIRNHCYEAIGGMDESFKRVEDDELFLRLTRRFKGVNIEQFVVKYRWHDGVRGDKTTRHAFNNRAQVNLEFHRRMFTRVRNETPLWAYLSGTENPDLDAGDHLQALLTRAASMARHGLWGEFLEDIKLCADVRADYGAPLLSTHTDLVSMAFSRWVSVESAFSIDGFPLVHVKAVIRSLGPDSRRAIVRGFYWAAREARSRKQFRLAWNCIWAACRSGMILG